MRRQLLVGGIIIAALAGGAWAYPDPDTYRESRDRFSRTTFDDFERTESDPTGTVSVHDGRLIVVDLHAARYALADVVRQYADEIEDDDGQRRRSRGRLPRRPRSDDDDDDDEDEGRRRGRSRWERFPDGRRDPVPGRTRNETERSRTEIDDSLELAFNHGAADGYQKGLEDGRSGRGQDPTRHRWYNNGDRGYDGVSSREAYRQEYREGFREGYEVGNEDGSRTQRGRNSRWPRLPWPF